MVAMGLYTLVHVETRFVGAYVSILWMAILFSVRLSSGEHRKMAEYLSLAVVFTILLSVADGTVRTVRAGGPYSALDQVMVADSLQKMGLKAGDPVAVVGDGNWAYWARSGRFRIVTTVTSSDAPAFWAEKLDQQQEVYDAFARTGARAVVTKELSALNIGNGWQPVGTSEYYVRWLP